MGKDTFIIYTSFYKPISFLSDKQLGRLFRAIFRYNLGEVVEVEDDIRMAFEFFKNQFEIDEGKYQAKIMRDIENRIIGANHWNWKGGVTDERHRIRESAKYKRWRVQVFVRDKYTCQRCKKIGGKLNAHHIKPFSVYPELRFDIDNGVTLCRNCHIKLHKIEREWGLK